MNNKIFNANGSCETIDESEYRELITQKDKFIKIGDISNVNETSVNKAQGGFATGFVLGISAGVAFVICIVVLYLIGIIHL